MKSFSIPTMLVAVLLGAGLSSAQSLIVSQGQVVAFSGQDTTPTGDVAPGLAGDLFGGNQGPNPAVIDDAGRLLFRAQLVNSLGVAYPSNQQHLSRAYFLGDSRGNLVKILRGGEAEPSGSIPGATLQLGNTGGVALGSAPRISSNGLIMFGASIWDVSGGTITTVNDSALYAGTPGNWTLLAREGSPAPGCGGATYSSDFASMAYTWTGINASGQTLFQSALAGTGVVGTTNNIAWFTGPIGAPQLFLRKGDVALSGEVLGNVGAAAQMNASGQVLTEVTFLAGATPPVTTANDKAIWIYTPGNGHTEVVREGNASPIAGTFYGSPSLAGPMVFNASGQALIWDTLTGAVTTNVDDAALFVVTTSGNSVFLRRGSPAPGTGGANFLTVANFNMVMNDSGTAAFTSTLIQGGPVTGANDSGLWVGTAGNLTLVAREGDVAPGSGGQTFGAFSSTVFLNAAGQVLFQNALSGGAFATSYYSWDPVLGLQPVIFPTDTFDVQPGVPRTLGGSYGTAPNSNGAGRMLSFANDGTATFRTPFSDGSFAIVKVRIGSLTAVPRKISEATGGVQKLYLQAGLAHAGQFYAVAGSASGTAPGTPIGAFVVPLNIDAYTYFTLDNANIGPYVNTQANLNANGQGLAQIVIPPLPGFAGVIVHHAFGVLDGSGNLVFASEPVTLEIIP